MFFHPSCLCLSVFMPLIVDSWNWRHNFQIRKEAPYLNIFSSRIEMGHFFQSCVKLNGKFTTAFTLSPTGGHHSRPQEPSEASKRCTLTNHIFQFIGKRFKPEKGSSDLKFNVCVRMNEDLSPHLGIRNIFYLSFSVLRGRERLQSLN